MRLDAPILRDLLADAWERWAGRCAELTPQHWSTPTRCSRWDVAALVAHVCPDPAMFDMLDGAKNDGPAAVTDAAELLGRFNAADGIAHTKADELAEQAVSDAETLASDVAVGRFSECAHRLRATPVSKATVIRYPGIGSTTIAVVAEVALMEAWPRSSSAPAK